MPPITRPPPESAAVRKSPISPDDSPVDGSNCLTVCLYNIPRGGLTILVPALVVFATGILALCLAVTSPVEDGRSRDWPSLTAPAVVSCVGLIWTALAIVYWMSMWCKHRPLPLNSSRRRDSVDSDTWSISGVGTVSLGNSQTVELVSVYWLS